VGRFHRGSAAHRQPRRPIVGLSEKEEGVLVRMAQQEVVKQLNARLRRGA